MRDPGRVLAGLLFIALIGVARRRDSNEAHHES